MEKNHPAETLTLTHDYGPGVDLRLLQPAAHEAGHALACVVAGYAIADIRVWHTSNSAAGALQLADDIDDRQATDELLVSLVAGHEAEVNWLSLNTNHPSRERALRETQPGCCTDLELFARYRRRSRHTSLTEAAARGRAEALLRQHWRRVERLTVRLARAKHLTNPTG